VGRPLEQTAIDKIIEPSLEAVIRRKKGPVFYKSEVQAQILKHSKLGEVLTTIRDDYGEWGIDEVVRRYINVKLGQVLQKRDANGVRVYECYGAGESERRWQPLRALTRETLRAVMMETRTQERQLNIKGRGYQYFLDELEKLGEDATVDDVYDKVVPKLVAGHSAG
jgi:hypothetical protein